MSKSTPTLFPAIVKFISSLDTGSIPVERQAILKELAAHLSEKLQNHKAIRLNFICTHNSRRSHLGQVWGQTIAQYFGLHNVQCYSGGTEATALYPMVAKVLAQTGFQLDQLSEDTNPVYSIKHSPNEPAVIGFSKAFDHSFNPTDEFAAIMTCSQANEACPIVMGADARFALTYEDPKAFDNTPVAESRYAERSLQIATELYFAFSHIQH